MSFSAGVFSINTAGQPVVSGTTISSVAFNALTADLASGLSTCLLKDGSQAATAIIPFASGITIAGGNTLAAFITGTTASTFTFDGSGGTSGSVTMAYQKVGGTVTLKIPSVTATTGTNSQALQSNTALPASVRPATGTYAAVPSMVDNGAGIAPAGIVLVQTNGIVIFNRDGAGTFFTNTATAGAGQMITVDYFV